MRSREHLAVAFDGLVRTPLRTFLTVLAIVMGTAATIAVVSILQGFKRAVVREMEGFGAGYVLVVPDRPTQSSRSLSVPAKLTEDDEREIRSRVPHVQLISPAAAGQLAVVHGNHRRVTNVVGVGGDWQELRNHFVERGRFFSPVEAERHRKVAVLGSRVAEELDLGQEPIGADVQISGIPLTVIGVLEKRGRSLGRDADDVILVPFQSALSILGRSAGDQIEIHIRAESASTAGFVRDAIVPILRQRHGLKGMQPDDFKVHLQDEMLKGFERVLAMVTAIVAGILGISLLVAGIGIMNIMLVSVKERTPEIGVRRAVGAKQGDLLLQFLIEATVLSGVGGIIGIGLGYGAGALLTHYLPGELPPAHVPFLVVLGAFAFCAVIGVAFGLYPADRAARLAPAEALRYE